MPDFLPFCGYRFSPELSDRLANILAPPYDNVSLEKLGELWAADPYNAVRLVLPPPEMAAGDFVTQSVSDGNPEWYAGANQFLNDWIREGVLRREKSAYFFYRQDHSLDGQQVHRWGVIGALVLTDKNETLLHERTFEGPKADRLRLIKETQANLCSVFTVATDPEGTLINIASTLDPPVVDCATPDGIRHRLYVVTDDETIQATSDVVRSSTLMIADGHHRYETALNYRAWVRENSDSSCWPPADALMVYVCPMPQDGLVILPTHRVVRNLGPGWLDRLTSHASLGTREVSGRMDGLIRELKQVPETDVVVGVTDGDRFLLAIREKSTDPVNYATVHPALRDVEVMYLHRVILKHILGVSEENAGRISYARHPSQALAMVEGQPGTGAFFLRPPAPERVMEVSRSGQRMPQKSTDFFPKIPTGLVIRLLREPPAA